MKQKAKKMVIIMAICLLNIGCATTQTVKIGIYRLAIDNVAPSIVLNEDNTYELIVPSYSSKHNIKTCNYKVENSHLILVSDDNQEYYFKIDDNSIIYDENKSPSSNLFWDYIELANGDTFEMETIDSTSITK